MHRMPLLGYAPGPEPASRWLIAALEPYWRWRAARWRPAPRSLSDDTTRRLTYQSARASRLRQEIHDLDVLIATLEKP